MFLDVEGDGGVPGANADSTLAIKRNVINVAHNRCDLRLCHHHARLRP